jgi:hypothetical protein
MKESGILPKSRAIWRAAELRTGKGRNIGLNILTVSLSTESPTGNKDINFIKAGWSRASSPRSPLRAEHIPGRENMSSQ